MTLYKDRVTARAGTYEIIAVIYDSLKAVINCVAIIHRVSFTIKYYIIFTSDKSPIKKRDEMI